MAPLARKLAITARDDGLLLRPTNSKGAAQHDVKISYGSKNISTVPRSTDLDGETSSLDAHGIFGILDLVETFHLIVITRREQIASIRGKGIFTVREVVLIPLTSEEEARKAIDDASARLKKAGGVAGGSGGEGSGAEHDEDDDGGDAASVVSVDDVTEGTEADEAAAEKGMGEKSKTSAKDAVQSQSKGYGRFARRWFTRNTSKQDVNDSQGSKEGEPFPAQESKDTPPPAMRDPPPTTTASETKTDAPDKEDGEKDPKPDATKENTTITSLTPRILRTARLYFSTTGFFFSYDHDLSGSLTQRSVLTSESPLWKRFGEDHFWNRHLIDSFIKAGVDELVLPLMQGFVGQRTFSIAKTDAGESDTVDGASQSAGDVVAAQETPSTKAISDDGKETREFVLTLISRRSIKRAGLRYMRRGIDDDGNAANTVETEQMLSPMTWDPSEKTFSLVQLRGSIPLHFTQTPGALKPTPVLFGSEATNQAAFRKHLNGVAKHYGDIQMVSLIDAHPPEVTVGEAFKHHSELLNESGGIDGKPVAFEWFDFHTICKGMKFENVSILLGTLEEKLKAFGWITKQDDRNIGLQSGVVRTNCMDCLDRTNVVQAAIGGWALEQQLKSLGLSIDLQKDPKTQWFNTLWADNGDAISKQYANSAAMKGDFTRTRHRTWLGAMSDLSLTMTRYYNNFLNDYFLQMSIDYFLGNTGPAVFEEFETEMMSKDYALDIGRIRQDAIDRCNKIVLEDPDEKLIGGWTLSCPKESNTLRTLPFEECVVLLTKTALYFCRFDWDTEKVSSFEKVDLRDVQEIWRGAYITSALGATHLDESKNYGFALRYKTSGNTIVRRNTRSLGNAGEAADENEGKTELEKQAEPEKEGTRLLAFKALPPGPSTTQNTGKESLNEVQVVTKICSHLHQAVEVANRQEASKDGDESPTIPQVEEKDVISVADAKKGTGYVESIGYSLKRLVWS